MPSDQTHVTNRLAQFLAGSQWKTIPSEVRREGVRGLLNFFGCALGGVQDEAMSIAVKVLRPFFGPPQGIVIGRGDRPDALNAAFLNAVSANVLEYDDTHLGTVMHPAAPVAPGLFALAGLRPVSGRELLHAFILGVEISCRVGLGVMPTHYRRGWHITATCGIFGAAAACARLLGLDAQRTAWALGHAATQSASLVEGIGSMTKSLGVGNAAKNGQAAALFAEGGFSGPESPIEGCYGFAAVTSDSADLARIADGIGQRWEMLNNAYKPYPCGVVLFPVIDACLELRARLAGETEAIDRVVVRGHPLMRERTDRPNVESGRDARVSLQHTVAAAFLFAAAGLAQYEDDCVADPAVRALRARVVFEEELGAPVESATVTLYLADGTEQSEHIRHGRGTPGRPMSDAELDSKVRELVAYGAPFVDPDGLIAAVRGIEAEADPTRLMRLTVPA
ncbi:MAG: MmgE/PrpD family protein [Alphaproteobacteria bacterium]|nr:MmgE/PrpD family protein [Alphaproteobacteria bacterium]